jgi:hypothetical protein
MNLIRDSTSIKEILKLVEKLIRDKALKMRTVYKILKQIKAETTGMIGGSSRQTNKLSHCCCHH